MLTSYDEYTNEYYFTSNCIAYVPQNGHMMPIKIIQYNITDNGIKLFYVSEYTFHEDVYVLDFSGNVKLIPEYTNSVICDNFADDFYKTGIKGIRKTVSGSFGDIILDSYYGDIVIFDNLPKYLIKE